MENGRKLMQLYFITEEELEYLRKSAIPLIKMKTVLAENGILEIENVLKAQVGHTVSI